MTDAELCLGLSRHLSAYQMSPERAALEQLEFAGWTLDMAFRLEGSTTSSARRVQAIGLDVGVGARNLKAVLATMEGLDWISIERDDTQKLVSITERIPTRGDLILAAPALLRAIMVTPVESAALALLRATALQPLLIDDALQAAADADGVEGDDECVESALRHLTHTGLVRRVGAADGREVLYNPNIWVQGDSIAEAALRAADARATPEVTALLQELAESPGMPEEHVTSTERKWVDFAVSQNLVQRSVVQTSDGGVERGFLFTPHLGRDPFGGNIADVSGHVRQLVGSMMYAATYAEYKLNAPEQFLRSLINRGVAGNASPIGTDYPMLEKAGVVRVVDGYGAGRYSLQLLQPEVAHDALKMLDAREGTGTESSDIAALRAQRAYVHVEKERARLALTTGIDEVEQARLIAALREVPVKRMFGGRG
ncbi:hypothetical protein AQJ46_48380 [Streptomyces canus]|uniref:Uncharacterized protein n=1 Tax=Streptomyces canus TaxID=58343 RepID=A0A101RKX2_9ACTN|nr:hypothetical protein [Streptomyces canus]KUN57202.1 hypothetical protein AQJ46_48380 [Streptomyces canus]